MQILLAENRGFCPGVRKAIELAEQALQVHKKVFSLGEIIHNRYVVDKLRKMGLEIVNSVDEIAKGGVVLIRSHGASPEIFERAQKRNLTIIDATCVLVKRAQNIVRQLDNEGYQLVMVGNKNHPEVKGIIGYANNVIVIQNEDDIAKLGKLKKIGLVSQTTLDRKRFAKIASLIIEQGFQEIRIINTLCEQAVGRQRAAAELAKKVDVMFVLGGKHSSNTTELANISRNCGTKTFHIEDFSQFTPDMITQSCIIGITAGASTPENIVQEFVEGLQKYDTARESETA